MGLQEGMNLFSSGDDSVHRLNSYYTVIILLTTAIVVTVAPLVTNPLTCFTATNSNITLIRYAERLCWRNHLYSRNDRNIHMYSYRHYLGVIIVGQALIFLSILLIWQYLQVLCGLPLRDITKATAAAGSKDRNLRDSSIRYLVKRVLMRSRGCNYFLTSCALVVKLLYCLNAILQLTFISAILKVTPLDSRVQPSWPLAIFTKNIMIDIDGTLPPDMRGFSRSVSCDFSQNRQYYSAQCEVVISEFYESVFAGLWLWLIFVCSVTCVGTITWSMDVFVSPIKNAYVTDRLVATGRIPEAACANRLFTKANFSGDAYLITRHVRLSGGDVTASEVVAGLWDEYERKNTSGVTASTDTLPSNKGTLTRLETPL